MFWRKKNTEEPRCQAPETITLSADDNMHERARKLWRLVGMANDRFAMVPALAGYLAAYRELDEQRAKSGNSSTARPTETANI